MAVNDYVAGEFLWIGMDFTGEARRFPAHGSAAGLLDLEGFWKPAAYLRQALWSSNPMVYAAARATGAEATGVIGRGQLVERWGWTADPRKTIPLEIYTNCEAVEVLLNGRSLGEKHIADRLVPGLLFAVPNEAGRLEVVGKNGGAVAARFELKSPGAPAKLQLTPDRSKLQNDGRQVATVEVQVVDAAGNRIPDALNELMLEVKGPGRLIAVGNADLTDGTPATGRIVKAYQGRAVAVVRSGAGSGAVTLRVVSPGLAAAEIVIAIEP